MAGINQMSRQMGISKGKASSLMKTAKKMNGSSNTDDRSMKPKGFASGGMARIQGTPPAQVKGFTYNDNGGKGTF
jgi:hypothetical protein